jgi:uncharacterized protein (TIGR03086 family)
MASVSEIDVLESVLGKTARLLDGVQEADMGRPTPCSEFDVAALRDHIVGWSQQFAAGSAERTVDLDPSSYRAGDDAPEVFRDAASEMVQGWRDHGLDREVRLSAGASPGPMVFNMTMMEYLTHGWDLATATGQPVPFTEDEAADALARAEATLRDEYRGDVFAPRVEVPADAPAIDRFVGFMGRDPNFRPS